jgi:hypothetical protein
MPREPGYTIKRVDEFKRQCLDELMALLKPEQRERLDRCYPRGYDDLSDSDLRNAIRLCEATIAKNEGC